MTLKKASISDLDALCQIENESFDANSFAMSRPNFIYHIKNGSVFIYKYEDKIAGYVLILLRKDSLKARVYSIAVREDFKGKGIASILLERALSHAKQNGKTNVKLEVRVDNVGAIKLYEKLGFLTRKIIKSYYPDGMDALSMEKTL